jgi:hypothetical protein
MRRVGRGRNYRHHQQSARIRKFPCYHLPPYRYHTQRPECTPTYVLTVRVGLSCLADLGAALLGPTLATASLAHPAHALGPLRAAVGAAAAVPLVGLMVYAPLSAAALAFRAAANLPLPTPYAVLRAAPGVPTASADRNACSLVVRKGRPRYHGGQRGSHEGASDRPYGLAPRGGVAGEPLGQIV